MLSDTSHVMLLTLVSALSMFHFLACENSHTHTLFSTVDGSFLH